MISTRPQPICIRFSPYRDSKINIFFRHACTPKVFDATLDAEVSATHSVLLGGLENGRKKLKLKLNRLDNETE